MSDEGKKKTNPDLTSDPAFRRYEQVKRRNFRNSCRLEGIILPENPSEESLEEILDKYRNNLDKPAP